MKIRNRLTGDDLNKFLDSEPMLGQATVIIDDDGPRYSTA